MLRLFPPGGISWSDNRVQSRWREFAFVYHQLQRAVEPMLPLQMVLEDWESYSKSLAEAPRQRPLQQRKIFEQY